MNNMLWHAMLLHHNYGIDEYLSLNQIYNNINTNNNNINTCDTLEKLYNYVCNFNDCNLKHTAIKTVFSSGQPKSKIMLIGEAPGADEDLIGEPFVGMSGKLLDKILSSIDLSREKNVYISNIIPWRPPSNRNPTDEEITICLPIIEKHIAIINPKIIILVGGIAAKSLLKTTNGISFLRGKLLKYKNPFLNRYIDAFAIYHPAYLLRSPRQKKQTWNDMLYLKKILSQ